MKDGAMKVPALPASLLDTQSLVGKKYSSICLSIYYYFLFSLSLGAVPVKQQGLALHTGINPLLQSVTCNGNESNLMDCQLKYGECSSDSDLAGIKCQGIT